MSILEEKMVLAQKGRALWQNLEEKYQKNPFFLFLYEEELAQEAISFLPKYLERKGYDVGVILQLKGEVPDTQLGHDFPVEILEKEEGEALLSLYEMYQFTSRLRIVSLNRPFGSKLQNLQQTLTVTELVQTCLFH